MGNQGIRIGDGPELGKGGIGKDAGSDFSEPWGFITRDPSGQLYDQFVQSFELAHSSRCFQQPDWHPHPLKSGIGGVGDPRDSISGEPSSFNGEDEFQDLGTPPLPSGCGAPRMNVSGPNLAVPVASRRGPAGLDGVPGSLGEQCPPIWSRRCLWFSPRFKGNRCHGWAIFLFQQEDVCGFPPGLRGIDVTAGPFFVFFFPGDSSKWRVRSQTAIASSRLLFVRSPHPQDCLPQTFHK